MELQFPTQMPTLKFSTVLTVTAIDEPKPIPTPAEIPGAEG